MDSQAPLPSFLLSPGVSMIQAAPWHAQPVTLRSPALTVMTDLTKVKAATIRPELTLHQAEQTMIYQGVRLLFVVSEMPALEGLITTTDLSGERPMSLLHQRNQHYDELRVADVMTPLRMLEAIEFDSIAGAIVGNVVATLKRAGRNHLLVVQAAAHGEPRRVRGVISRAQVERQLGTQIAPVPSSYSEMGHARL